MADETVDAGPADPSGNTQQFRAFVHGAPAERESSRLPLMIAAAAAAVIVAVVLFYLLR
jgi:hypothetical protein